jgi:hypothetical protein
MEFVTLKDVDAPQDHVFRAMVDFSAFERQALRLSRSALDGGRKHHQL